MRKIHLDMDGVLVDLESSVIEATGYRWGEISSTKMWRIITERRPDIFASARPRYDAYELVSGVLDFAFKYRMQVEILTAIPRVTTFPEAESQKRFWIKYHFPFLLDVFKIGPRAPDKKNHARLGDILIDDSTLNTRDWGNAGGIAIRHVSAEESLKQLHTSGYRYMKLFH